MKRHPQLLHNFLNNRIFNFIKSVDQLQDELISTVNQIISDDKAQLKQSSMQLYRGTTEYLKIHNEKMVRYLEILSIKPGILVKSKSQELDYQVKQLTQIVNTRLQSSKQKINSLGKMIDFLRPQNTLKRGFSITKTAEGKIVRDAAQIVENETLYTDLYNGKLISTVKEIKKGKE